MGYIMSLGSNPVGEIYLTPPDKGGEAWLVGHYYDGGDVKLLRFKSPLSGVEDGSPIDRIQQSEDRDLLLMKIIMIMKQMKMKQTNMKKLEKIVFMRYSTHTQKDKLICME